VDTIARGFALAEAPVWDGSGLYFSSVIGGGVFRVEPGGRPVEVIARRKGVGGGALTGDGRLIVTGREVICGEDVVVAHEPGITGYNDCGTLADGSLIVGALRFHPMSGETPVPAELVRVAPDGSSTHQALPEITWPNGIACAPDGETFYVADYQAGVVWRDGVQRFCSSPKGEADGLAVDVEGGLWVALGSGAGVARFSSSGSLDFVLDVSATFVSSVCFGGEDLRDLYITTGDAVLRERVDVAGLPVPRARVV
jgi:sugar lactone lactonase YvrE